MHACFLFFFSLASIRFLFDVLKRGSSSSRDFYCRNTKMGKLFFGTWHRQRKSPLYNTTNRLSPQPPTAFPHSHQGTPRPQPPEAAQTASPAAAAAVVGADSYPARTAVAVTVAGTRRPGACGTLEAERGDRRGGRASGHLGLRWGAGRAGRGFRGRAWELNGRFRNGGWGGVGRGGG